jgi:NOL1/NOP2/sun family putative RNA methylase
MRRNDIAFDHYREVIPEFSLFLESIRRPLPTHIRVNQLMIEPADLVRSLELKGVCLKRSSEEYDTLYLVPGLESPGNLIEYFLGYIHPQALTSCLAAYALSVREGSSVLDMCASPGGKASHVADLMKNTGLIVTNELYPSRQASLRHTLDRLGVLNAVVTGYQAQEFPLKVRFDYVLADAPCSGDGRFRKTNDSVSYRRPRDSTRFPELQKRIILRGFDLLKEDGQMLYATCTYNPEEDESVVNFLLDHRDAILLPIEVGLDYDPGLVEWKDEKYQKQLERGARFYPHRLDSVGFFMARIGRRG